jgi:radical SAM superfamily enzyme YgiQ (UPF0313 family)
MAKVLFIYPNINAQEGFNHGIAALSGSLKAIGAETELLHLNDSLYELPSIDDIVERVSAFDPHLICFTAMSQQYKYALKIAKALKERFPYPIAIGGVHATMVPEEVASVGVFDFIGQGECDHALAALVKAIREDRDTTSIPNIWARTGDRYKRNFVGPFPDLNLLAPKDYEIFDLDHMIPRMNGWMSIITSRGCPYRCTYCFNHRIVKRYREESGVKPSSYLRRYAIPRIMDEMTALKERHPDLQVFIFDDDLFTLNERYVLEFCEAYTASGLNLPFVLNGHVQVFTPAMAKALKAAGCMIVKFGVESGSQRIRRNVLKRDMTDEMIIKAFECAHEAGLHSSAFIMIGLPLEEREDLDATIDMLARLEAGRFRWAMFYPFPGTDIHRLCKDEGLIDPKKMENLDNFYEASPLRLEPGLDLFLNKLQRCLHWYVNARSAFNSAPVYREKIEELERLSLEEWRGRARSFLDEDRQLSERMEADSGLHYSIRFTQVMAVRSDFIEKGTDLSQPAKEWKSKPQQSL